MYMLTRLGRLSRTLTVMALVGAATICAPGYVPKVLAQQGADDKETAKKVLGIIRKANAEFDNQKYQSAFQRYKKAYDLYPDPAILVRLGKTAEKLGRTRKAIDFYREFARLMPDDEAAVKLADRADELAASLPVTVTVTSEPTGADIHLDAVDGRLLGTTPDQVDIEPGGHKLFLTKKGFQPATRQVEVRRDENQTVSVRFTQPSIVSHADAQAPPTSAAGRSELDRLPVFAWSLAGIGVLTLATSGTFLILSHSKAGDANTYDKRAGGATKQDLQGLVNESDSFYDVAVITGIAGGVLTAAGAGLLSYHYLGEDDSVAWKVDASMDTNRAWFGVDGRF